jgi:hypothetical protein
VARTAWWLADGHPGAVLAWIQAHVPPGFTKGGSGSTQGPSGIAVQFDEFDRPPVPGVLWQRSMLVAVAADGADRTAIRVDAQVVWLPPKPAAERIPAAAKVVTITPIAGLRPLPPGVHQVTVTRTAKVTRIASAVDGLPIFPPGVFSCPADFGREMRLTFRAGKAGPVLAVVTAEVLGCGAVQVRIEGKPMPDLWYGGVLEQRVLAIAGLRWPDFTSYVAAMPSLYDILPGLRHTPDHAEQCRSRRTERVSSV